MRPWISAAVVALALGVASTARADSPPRLVIVPEGVAGALVERIRGELLAMGCEVVVSAPEPVAREKLEATARASAAIAAVGVRPANGGLELWIADRITGKTVVRAISDEGSLGDATVALRAVELLRASLMEIDAPHAPRGEIPAPPQIRAVARLPEASPRPPPRSPLVSLDIAPAIVGSPGGLPPFAAIQVGARGWLRPSLSLGLMGLLGITTMRATTVEGWSATRVHAFGAEVRGDLAPRAARWIPSVSGGVLVTWLHTAGHGQPPGYVGLDGDRLSAVPFVRPALSLSLSPRVKLRADLLAGLSLRRFVIDHAGRAAARWGLPVLSGALGAEVDLW